MADKAFDDNDQSVYKTHILYVAPKDPNCVKLLSKLESMPLFDEVFVQDIAQLRQRPAWLDGVPILVCKKTNQAHKGQNIYTYAQAYQPDEFLPAGAVTGGWSSFEDGENYGSFDRKFSSLFNSATYDLEEDGPGRGGVGAPVASPGQGGSGNGGAGSSTGGGLNEKQLRRQHSEQEAQQRAQEMVNVRQQQDQLIQSRHKPTTPLARTAFSTDDGPALRHPPPNPMAAQQRAPDARQPMYGSPQQYAPVAPQYQPPVPQYHQQPQQYAPQQYAQQPHVQGHAQQQYYSQAQGQPHYQHVQPQAPYYQPSQYYQHVQQPVQQQVQPQYYAQAPPQQQYGYY